MEEKEKSRKEKSRWGESRWGEKSHWEKSHQKNINEIQLKSSSVVTPQKNSKYNKYIT